MINPFSCEDDVTDRIVELLKEKKYLRNLILQWLFPEISNEILDSIEGYHIILRNGVGDGSRPDISIQNEKCFLLIENKISERTPLTYSSGIRQSDWFTDLVRDAKADFSRGIFLVPKDYDHEDDILTDIKTVHKASDYMKIKYWSDFLDYLENLDLDVLKMDILFLREAVSNAKGYVDCSNSEKELLATPEKIKPVLELTGKVMKLFKDFLDSNGFKSELVFFNDEDYPSETFDFIGYRFNFKKYDKEYESAILMNISGNIPDSSYELSFALNKNDYEENDELCSSGCVTGRTSRIYIPIYSDENDLYSFMDDHDVSASFKKVADRILKKIFNYLK